MPVLVRYCLTALWPPFLVSTGVIVSIFNLMFQLIPFLKNLLGYKVGILNSFLLLLYLQPGFLVLAIPIGFLTALMIVYGRLSADGEVMAIESCGFSVWSLVWPMIAVSVLLSFFLVVFMDTLMPWGNTSFLKLDYKIISERSDVLIQEGVFIKDFEGYSLLVRKKNDATGLLQNVQLLDQREKPERIILATEGFLRQDPINYHAILELSDGVIQQEGTKKDPNMDNFLILKFRHFSLDLNAGRLHAGVSNFLDARNISMKDLAGLIREKKLKKQDTRYDECEFHKKFTLPFSALAFALIGIPLGLLSRTRSVLSSLVAIMLVMVYWCFQQYGEVSSPMGLVSPFVAMWLPNALLIILGFVLIYRLNHKHDFWKNPFRGEWPHRESPAETNSTTVIIRP